MFRIIPFVGLIYLLIRLHWLVRSRRLRWILQIGVTLFFAVAIWVLSVYRHGPIELESTPFQLAAWSGLGVFGYFGSILLLLIPLDLLLLVAMGMSRIVRRKPLVDPSRRAFVRETMGVAVLGIPAVTTAVGLWQGVSGPRVKEVEVPVPHLPPDLDGLKIAQISDLHVAPTILRPYVEKVVELVQAQSPDLIALTGDLVDGTVGRIRTHTDPLADLRAPLGVYYVTGNHEYYAGEREWTAYFVSQGMIHLSNSHRLLKRGSATLMVAGVPDKTAPRYGDPAPDAVAAARGGESADYRILFAHRPDACYGAAEAGFDLQMSGHTHAGQFHPWSFYVPLAHPYTRGLNRHGQKLWVYVNAGTGYWGPPTRFGIPSEVTLLRLKRTLP